MSETSNLHGLIPRQTVIEWLERFVPMGKDLKFVLFETDSQVFAQTGAWDNAGLLSLTTQVTQSAIPFEQDGYRVRALQAGGRRVGVLVVTGQPSEKAIGSVVHHSLELLLAQAAERQPWADEALDRGQEVSLLYRVGETISATLDPEAIPLMVLSESCRVIDSDLAAVIIFDEAGWHTGATSGREMPAGFDELVSSLTATYQDAQQLVTLAEVPGVISPYDTLLWTPLIAAENRLGGILLGRGAGNGAFTAREEILISALARQAAVALDNARLHQAELVKQRMEQELQLGFKMQSSLIPDSVPALAGWEFSAWWQPAREVSGDYYDFIPLGEQLGIVIADVADKGVHAALFMALTRSTVRASVTALHEPAESLRRANHLIAADATDGMFVTLFYAQFDTDG